MSATAPQQPDLMALAQAVLQRNKQKPAPLEASNDVASRCCTVALPRGATPQQTERTTVTTTPEKRNTDRNNVATALKAAAEEACFGLGIEPDELLAALSADDVADFSAGLFPFAALRALADVLVIRRMVDIGQVPATFTATAACTWCGNVYVSPAFAGRQLKSCPWCLNRHRHKPIPRPPLPEPSGKHRS